MLYHQNNRSQEGYTIKIHFLMKFTRGWKLLPEGLKDWRNPNLLEAYDTDCMVRASG